MADFEAELEAQTKVEERRKQLEERKFLRESNSKNAVENIRREMSNGKMKLKFDLKKSTAFAKKLKIISDSNYSAVLKDAQELNLTRYVSECVVALTEAIIKANDIPLVIQIISLLHQRYPEFSTSLVENYTTWFQKPRPSNPLEVKGFMLKRRITLRLLAEMYIAGIIEDVSCIVAIIDHVTTRNNKKNQLDVSLLVSFAKSVGYEFLGILSRKQQQIYRTSLSMDEYSEEQLVETSVQRHLKQVYDKAYDLISSMLETEHASLRKKENRNEKEFVNKGEVSEEHQNDLKKSRKLFEKLQTSVQSLADALDRDVPELPEEKREEDNGLGGLAIWGPEGRHELHEGGPFDDEDTRSFYEDLPNLLELVPRKVLGLTEQDFLALREKENRTEDTTEVQEEVEELEEADEAESEEINEQESEEVEEDAPKPGFSPFDMYLEQFEHMVNRERCDKAAMDFFYHNNKGSRKRLSKHLYSVPRTHLELLPYYSRFIAIINPIIPQVVEDVVKMLMSEFRYIQRKKNQYRLESKLRNIRFIAELVKFKVAPPNLGFRCLKQCLDDFQGHNIDIGTAFLEICGRYLYRVQHTHERMANFLEIMMRLKSVKTLDNRADTLIQNAYYLCKPPERSERPQKEYDPLYLYLKKMMYVDLNASNVNSIVAQIRKLPWKTRKEEMLQFFVKSVFKCTKGKFNHMHVVCQVVGGIVRQYDVVGIELIDQLIEAIEFGLEINDYREHQRQIGQVKLLSELFNCGIISTDLLFDILFVIINTGHDIVEYTKKVHKTIEEQYNRMYQLVPDMRYDPRIPCEYDGMTNTFRIRLVCTILETCGNVFYRGSSRALLIRFMTFFQRYIYTKKDISLETEFSYLDMFDGLNKAKVIVRGKYIRTTDKIPKFDTFEQAELEVQAYFEKELAIASIDSVIEVEEEEDEEEEEETHEEEEEDFLEECDEDDENIVVHDVREQEKEDTEFDDAFKSMMQGSLESRKHITRVNADNMAMPTVLRGTTHEKQEKNEKIVFRMLKRGNKGKVEARELLVPKDTSIAAHNEKQENLERQQQSELKRLVLQNVEREELMESSSKSTNWRSKYMRRP